MKKEDLIIVFVVDQTPSEIFNAVNNVRGWWLSSAKGESSKAGDEFTVQFGDVHFSRQKLVEVVPEKKVVWEVTESRLNFTADNGEWTGTRVIFEMAPVAGGSELRFTHAGLTPSLECFGGCSNAWQGYITGSLRKLITTGKGSPTP
ncbi:MAG: SRPBCC domain-containing protein [Chitinophagaceae bacterium]|nr:MAG: SRPBCC domain-containing protein [Chitinophagaceae bacterium]